MKKIFALILCLMLLCATPLVAFAEGEVTEEPAVTEEETTEEVPVETPTEDETPAEDEIVPPEDVPDETLADTPEVPVETPTEETDTDWEDVKTTISDAIVNWITPNLEEIGVVVTLIGYGIVLFRKIKTIIKSAGTINNNAITIADKSNNFMSQALSNIEETAGTVKGYEERILAVLEAFEQTVKKNKALEEINERLETELVEIKNYLKTSTDANVEFANELAELLGLANIPNYKKEEIGARHLESVKAIIEAEKKAAAAAILPANTEEVKKNVGEAKKD